MARKEGQVPIGRLVETWDEAYLVVRHLERKVVKVVRKPRLNEKGFGLVSNADAERSDGGVEEREGKESRKARSASFSSRETRVRISHVRDCESLEAFDRPRALIASEVEVGQDQLGLSPHLVPTNLAESVHCDFAESQKATGEGKDGPPRFVGRS